MDINKNQDKKAFIGILKYIKHISFFIVLITLSFSCKKKQDSYTIHVSGKVIDAVTSLPVAGAEIRYSELGGSSPYGDIITQSDLEGNYSYTYRNDEVNADGNFYFILKKDGYGGYTGGEKFHFFSESNLTNFDLQFHPNTFLSFIISKTTVTDSAIRVRYTEPNWYQFDHVINITNATSPDTLTIMGLAGMNNKIYLKVDRFNSLPIISPYMQTSHSYDVFCTTDTTQYIINY